MGAPSSYGARRAFFVRRARRRGSVPRRTPCANPLALCLLASLTLGCAPSGPAGEIALPGPGLGDLPGRASEAPEVQQACVECHAPIAEEWRLSYHHLSFTDPAFRASLSEENVPFCRRCHAPEAPSGSWPPDDLAAIGVGCATCHLAGHAIAAAPTADPRESPHAVARDPRFATAAACSGCHEFDFPGEQGKPGALQMQTTVTEHADSAYADRSCADCHMPWVGEGSARHRSHAFSGSRTPAAQADALHVEASREGGSVHVLLSPGEVGHAYPTGDLFRRLAVRAEAVTFGGALLAREEKYLARHFDRRRAPAVTEDPAADEDPDRPPRREPKISLAWDDRPGAPLAASRTATVDLDLGPAALDHAITVQVVLERVAKVAPGRPEREAPVESAVVLYQTVLPPPEHASLPILLHPESRH